MEEVNRPVTRRRACKPAPEPKPRRKSDKWTYGEKKALLCALKKYGFEDIAKIAEEVETRSEAEVEFFMERLTTKITKEANENEIPLSKLFNPKKGRKHLSEHIKNFPPIAVWKKTVTDFIECRFAPQDLSEALVQLFNRFIDLEGNHSDDPDMPNIKKIYKYLHDVLLGCTPATLSPIDSAIVLFLIEDMNNFIIKNDLTEEKKFVREFVAPTRFAPMKVKTEKDETASVSAETSESTEKASTSCQSSAEPQEEQSESPFAAEAQSESCIAVKDESVEFSAEDEIMGSASKIKAELDESIAVVKEENKTGCEGGMAISIPFDLFLDLVRHAKVKQNINPLLVPVWQLQSEQAKIKKYIASLQ